MKQNACFSLTAVYSQETLQSALGLTGIHAAAVSMREVKSF